MPRRDLVAAASAGLVLIELLLAQLTLGLTVIFVIVGRVTRWRPAWLSWPAVVGVYLMLARGARQAAAGYLAVARHLIGLAAGPGSTLAHLTHPMAELGGWQRWLSAQLPVALIAAAAQAGVVARVRGRRGGYRPGALAVARRAYLTASLRRGEVATREGCCAGVVTGTGRRAEISWREAEAGVVVTGATAAAATGTGLDLVIAAIQHRKAVLVIDLASAAGEPAAATIAAACAASHAPLRRLGEPGGRYDPLSGLPPARAAGLVMAMFDEAETAAAARQLCAAYLSAVLEVLADDDAAVWRHCSMIGELARLAHPGALQQRLDQADLPQRTRDALVSKAAECAGRLGADPQAVAALAAVADQLSGLASSKVGGWLGLPGPGDDEPVSLARAVAGRQVVIAELDPRWHGRPGLMMARLAVADLTGILTDRADLGVRADCLVWINGCEPVGRGLLSELLMLGEATGTCVVLGTTDNAAVEVLAAQVNVLVVRGREPNSEQVSIRVRGPRPRLVKATRASGQTR